MSDDPHWISPVMELPQNAELIVFKVASGAIFLGFYSTVREYPAFVRQDGHGSYTPKVVRGWIRLPK